MRERRQQVVHQLKELKSECRSLITVIEDTSLEKFRPPKHDRSEKSEKIYRDAFVALAESNKITSEHVEALYKLAKLHFECGQYGQVQASSPMGAAELLTIYRMLIKDPNSDTALSALWGKLASEILLWKWDDAIEDLKKLREIIDTRVSPFPRFCVHFCLLRYQRPNVLCFVTAAIHQSPAAAAAEDMAHSLEPVRVL